MRKFLVQLTLVVIVMVTLLSALPPVDCHTIYSLCMSEAQDYQMEQECLDHYNRCIGMMTIKLPPDEPMSKEWPEDEFFLP